MNIFIQEKKFIFELDILKIRSKIFCANSVFSYIGRVIDSIDANRFKVRLQLS